MESYILLNNIDELEKNDFLKIFREYGVEFCHEEMVDWRSLKFDDDAIRICGKIQTNPNQYIPRMHNKFIVFGSFENGKVEPKTVWTGSFNFPKAAANSFENAIILDSKEAASQYLKEFCLNFFLSEPLENANKDNMSPDVKYNFFKANDNVLVRTSRYEEDVDEDQKVFWLESKIIKTGTSNAIVRHVNGFKEKIPLNNIQSSVLKPIQQFKNFEINHLYIIEGKTNSKTGKLIKKTKTDNEIILKFELVHEKNKIIIKKYNGTIKNIFLSNEIY
ncbi:hypothetical protein ACTFIZ_002518 [Dictyostelium cf. discoideum]